MRLNTKIVETRSERKARLKTEKAIKNIMNRDSVKRVFLRVVEKLKLKYGEDKVDILPVPIREYGNYYDRVLAHKRTYSDGVIEYIHGKSKQKAEIKEIGRGVLVHTRKRAIIVCVMMETYHFLDDPEIRWKDLRPEINIKTLGSIEDTHYERYKNRMTCFWTHWTVHFDKSSGKYKKHRDELTSVFQEIDRVDRTPLSKSRKGFWKPDPSIKIKAV